MDRDTALRVTVGLTFALVLAVALAAEAAPVFEAAADAYVYGGGATTAYGSTDPSRLALKYDGSVTASRKTWLRYDLSSREGRLLSNPVLSLTFFDTAWGVMNATGAAFDWEFEVYGLNDGDAGEGWSESTVTWNNAPGNKTTSGNQVDLSRATSLGTFTVTGKGVGTHTFASPAVQDFLASDTDGRLSIIVVRNSTMPTSSDTYVHGLRSEESSAGPAPTLSIREMNLLRNGELEDASGDFNVSGWVNSGNVAIGHAPIVAGSSAAAYMQSSTNGNLRQDFAATACEWMFDVYFATELGGSPTDRGLDLRLLHSGGLIPMRVEGDGSFDAFGQTIGWQTIASAGTVLASVDANNDKNFEVLNVYHLRVLGHEYGTASANYDIYLSGANDPTLSLIGSGLQFWQYSGPFTSSSPGLTSMYFETTYGAGDFVVDAAYILVPEPTTLSLLGLGALALVRRRRRAAP